MHVNDQSALHVRNHSSVEYTHMHQYFPTNSLHGSLCIQVIPLRCTVVLLAGTSPGDDDGPSDGDADGDDEDDAEDDSDDGDEDASDSFKVSADELYKVS